MTGEQKEAAAKNMVNALHGYGCITERDRDMLIYKINAGDKTALKIIRAHLIKLSHEIEQY